MDKDDRSSSLTLDVPGDLGALFARLGFRARIVVEKADGTTLSPFDTEAAQDIAAAAQDRDARAGDPATLSDLMMVRRIARGDQREAARKAAKRKPRRAA